MSNNALFIVEGKKRERDIVNKLITKVISDNDILVHPFSVGCNIHMLYQKIVEMGGFVNIRDVLLTLSNVSDEDKALLNGDMKFAYTYLVFDMDLQHHGINTEFRISKGLQDIKEMLSYFNDETDDTVGKLYINYPMVESYKDHNSDVSNFLHRTVPLEDCVRYKQIASQRGDNKNFSEYAKDDVSLLIHLNLAKAGYITCDTIDPSYETYINQITQMDIFKAEESMTLGTKSVSVLNTLMLMPVDYIGKRYFDCI